MEFVSRMEDSFFYKYVWNFKMFLMFLTQFLKNHDNLLLEYVNHCFRIVIPFFLSMWFDFLTSTS